MVIGLRGLSTDQLSRIEVSISLKGGAGVATLKCGKETRKVETTAGGVGEPALTFDCTAAVVELFKPEPQGT